jgi:hypothetical protein
MPRYRHPRNIGRDDPAQFAVDLGGERVVLDADGCFETDADDAVARLADAHGYDVADLRVTDTCETVKSDGEVCGRDRPCPYHDE